MQQMGTGCMNPPDMVSMQPGLLEAELTLNDVGFVIQKREKLKHRCT